jgi:hypothetical protein
MDLTLLHTSQAGDLDFSVLAASTRDALRTTSEVAELDHEDVLHHPGCTVLRWVAPLGAPLKRVTYLEAAMRSCDLCARKAAALGPVAADSWWALRALLFHLAQGAPVPSELGRADELTGRTLADPALEVLRPQLDSLVANWSAPLSTWRASGAALDALVLASVLTSKSFSAHVGKLTRPSSQLPASLADARRALVASQYHALEAAVDAAKAVPGELFVASPPSGRPVARSLSAHSHLAYALEGFERTPHVLVVPRVLEGLVRAAARTTSAVLRTSDDERVLETATALVTDPESSLSAAKALAAARALL